ncbi:MAG: hypothetical protein OXC72_02010 [Roseovarius sp.]|nr:hypothetical protein [Roseovarius sp.]MCY4290518.1 hypothetical protein [Roseovarius sp.]
MYLISEDDVIHIHDQALNPGELQGLAGDKSLSGALSRVELRLACGLIKDAFDLGATCAVVYIHRARVQRWKQANGLSMCCSGQG